MKFYKCEFKKVVNPLCSTTNHQTNVITYSIAHETVGFDMQMFSPAYVPKDIGRIVFLRGIRGGFLFQNQSVL